MDLLYVVNMGVRWLDFISSDMSACAIIACAIIGNRPGCTSQTRRVIEILSGDGSFGLDVWDPVHDSRAGLTAAGGSFMLEDRKLENKIALCSGLMGSLG